MTPRNAFAFFHANPAITEEVARDVRRDGRFDRIHHRPGSWLTCFGPLRDPAPTTEVQESGGLIESDEPGLKPTALAAALASVDPRVALNALPGDFSYVGLVGQTLNVVRAVAGAVPVYLWSDAESAAVATRLTDLVRFLPVEPRLDTMVLGLGCASGGAFAGDRTFLRDVRRLQRGSWAVWTNGMWRTEAFWVPPATKPRRATRAQFDSRAEQLRSVLVRNLDRALAADGSNLLTFSGGVDSSSLAALAAGPLRRSFSTLTLLPPGTKEMTEATGRFVDPLLAGISRNIRSRWEWRLTRDQRMSLAERVPEVVFLVVHPALGLLPSIVAEEPTTVLFGGEFADDLFGSRLTLPDWIANTTATDLVLHPGAIPFGPRSLAKWGRQQLPWLATRARLPYPPRLPDFVRVEVKTEYNDWLSAQRREAATALTHPRACLRERLERIESALAQNWEACSALGVRRAFPFLSRSTVELAFATHPRDHLGPEAKRLLRRALAGLVPEANLLRRCRGSWRVAPEWAPWSKPLPIELAGLALPCFFDRGSRRVSAPEALHLTLLLNIVRAVRNQRSERERSVR